MGKFSWTAEQQHFREQITPKSQVVCDEHRVCAGAGGIMSEAKERRGRSRTQGGVGVSRQTAEVSLVYDL